MHIAILFDATGEEEAALFALVREAKTLPDEGFRPDGYSVSTTAGQVVTHLHAYIMSWPGAVQPVSPK